MRAIAAIEQPEVLAAILGSLGLGCRAAPTAPTRQVEVKPRLRGRATLIRCADDFAIGFEHEEDARRVIAVLGKRLGRYARRGALLAALAALTRLRSSVSR